MKIHHIGIYSKNIAKTVARYKQFFSNISVSKIFVDKIFNVKIVFIKNKDDIIYEFIEPIGKKKNIFSSIKKNQSSIHHLAYEVNNLEKEVKRLKRNGYFQIKPILYAVALKTKITFLINDDCVLIELVQAKPKVVFSKI